MISYPILAGIILTGVIVYLNVGFDHFYLRNSERTENSSRSHTDDRTTYSYNQASIPFILAWWVLYYLTSYSMWVLYPTIALTVFLVY